MCNLFHVYDGILKIYIYCYEWKSRLKYDKQNFLGSGRKFQIQLFKIEFYIYLYNMSFCSPFLCLLIKIQINKSIVQYIYGFTYTKQLCKRFQNSFDWFFENLKELIKNAFFFIYHMTKEIKFILINVI